MSQSRGKLRIRLVWRGEVRPEEKARSYSLSVEEAGGSVLPADKQPSTELFDLHGNLVLLAI
jgi:hypothetical protein